MLLNPSILVRREPGVCVEYRTAPSMERNRDPLVRHADDFADAHRRHLDDADLLSDHARWASADQLYGFSAECGLKAVLEMEGEPIEGKYREHVQQLWPEFVSFADGRRGADYLSRLPDGEPFRDWSHHDRYAHHRHFDETVVAPHREAARQVHDLVRNAIQGGQP